MSVFFSLLFFMVFSVVLTVFVCFVFLRASFYVYHFYHDMEDSQSQCNIVALCGCARRCGGVKYA